MNAKRDDDDEVDCVKSIEPVLSLERFASELRGVSAELVAPALLGVRHHGIANPASPDAGVVVTVIPRSDRAPHMATARGLHRYYRRTSNDIRYLEHYEVADYFGRRPHPRLEIEAGMRISVLSGVGSSPRTGLLDVAFLMHNRGRGLAHFPCISLGKPAEWPPLESPHDATVSRTLVSQHAPGRWWARFVAATPTLVIYPDDELDAVHARFRLHHLQGAFPNLRIPVQVVAADCEPVETAVEFHGDEIRRQWQLAMDSYVGG
ncbi:MAG TPA: hypothetical protein VNJ06_04440 [Gemmatimonadales bacterium]|nr:hypothetical protein [Gemmatimonadales bacterium]